MECNNTLMLKLTLALEKSEQKQASKLKLRPPSATELKACLSYYLKPYKNR
jgi:hypothetical protein